MYSATIEAPAKKGLLEIIRKQEESFNHKRAEFNTEEENEKIIIRVKADDATALRATLNSIAITISIYEKGEAAVAKDEKKKE